MEVKGTGLVNSLKKKTSGPAYRKLFLMTAISMIPLSLCIVSCGEKASSDDNRSGSVSRQQNKEISLGDEYLINAPKLGLKKAVKRYMPKVRGQRGWLDYSKAAEAAMNAGDYDSAEQLWNESIKLNSNVANSYFGRGRARYNSMEKKNDKALSDFEQAIELGERDPGAYERLAEIYYDRKDYQKALEVLSLGIEQSVAPRKLYRTRAPIYLSMGEKEKALEDYNTALKHTPTFTRGYIMRAQLYESLGRNEEALEDYKNVAKYEKSGERMEKKSVAVKLRASLLDKLGRHQEAVDDLTEGLSVFRKDDELLRLRGEQFMKLGKYQKAIEDFSRSIEVEPHYAGASYEFRSECYEKLGKKELAEADRKAAIKLKERPAEKPVY